MITTLLYNREMNYYKILLEEYQNKLKRIMKDKIRKIKRYYNKLGTFYRRI